jgi:hypothetical protein
VGEMSKQEILEKAIQKAIDGGWSPLIDENGYVPIMAWRLEQAFTIKWFADKDHTGTDLNFWQAIYVNHDFAKALWGKKEYIEGLYLGATFGDNDTKFYLPIWQYHLQMMVIAKDPIVYLGANL